MSATIFFLIKSPSFIGKNLYLLDHFQFSDPMLSSKDKADKHIKIGIIDGAIYKKHPELNRIKIKQKFFVDQYTEDDISHATSIAGIICAKNNNFGIRGILKDVNIVNAVVLSHSKVEQNDLANAIRYCADESVDAINISIELYNFSEELLSALEYANQRGITVFMANGNGGWRKKIKTIEKPKISRLVFVGMLDRDGEKASSNMEHRKPDLYEVGSSVVTLNKNGYQLCNGTSYSCAIATSKYFIE